MKMCFITLGSRGDVQPIIALGSALRARGHEVVVACMGAGLVSLVESSGLRAYELIHTLPDHDDSYQKALHKPISRVRAWRDYMRLIFPKISSEIIAACQGADVVLAHSDALSLATATATATGSAVIGYRFFPGTSNSAYPVTQYTPPGLAQTLLNAAPGLVKRASWQVGDYITWRHLRWVLNYHRNELGLAPLASMREMNEGLAGVLDLQLYDDVLTPELIAEFGPDKPILGSMQVAPLSWSEDDAQRSAAAELRTWMQEGEAPIYWGFGSIRVDDPDALAGMFAKVCARHGRRGLIVAGWSDLSTREFGDHVKVVEAVEHATVLPLCQAAVHHGGAGTTAACLRAGLPSLICSVLADQPFWGERVQTLGLGSHIPIRKLTEKKLEAALRTLFDPRTTENVKRVSAALAKGSATADRAVRAIEAAVAGESVARGRGLGEGVC